MFNITLENEMPNSLDSINILNFFINITKKLTNIKDIEDYYVDNILSSNDLLVGFQADHIWVHNNQTNKRCLLITKTAA